MLFSDYLSASFILNYLLLISYSVAADDLQIRSSVLYIPRRGWPPPLQVGGKTRILRRGPINPLLRMPPADRRRGQWNDAMHRPRRDKNAEAFLKSVNFSAAVTF